MQVKQSQTAFCMVYFTYQEAKLFFSMGYHNRLQDRQGCTRMIFLYFTARAQDFLFIRELRAALRWETAEQRPSEQKRCDGIFVNHMCIFAYGILSLVCKELTLT